MDDTGILTPAMDCALADPEMSNGHNGTLAGISVPPDLPEPPPPEEGEPGILDADPTVNGLGEDAEGTAPVQIIEALLFSSDAPLSAARLTELVGSGTPAGIRKQIAALNEKYARAGLSFRIEVIARGYQMMTLPDFRPWIAKLHKQRSETRLSAAALETLAIIAYKQPIIRADVEAIRGVACSEVIGRLREMGLIRIVGRAEVVGRPLLYSTTRKFLDVFGLADLDDLPPMEALRLKPATHPPEEAEPEAIESGEQREVAGA